MADPVPMTVQAADGRLSLLPHAQLLQDRSRRLSLAEVRRDTAEWKPAAAGNSRNFGITHSAWWLRWRLLGAAAAGAQHRILELASPMQDYMDLYLVRSSGEVLASYRTGALRPFAQRGLDYRNPSFPLTLAPGEPFDVYLRLDAYDGLFQPVGVYLWNPPDFIAKTGAEVLTFGSYFGALLALLVYNLLLFLSTRDRSYGLYVLYVTQFFAYSFILAGFALQYWWPDHPGFNLRMYGLTASAAFLAFMVFVGEYVQIRASPSRMQRAVFRIALLACGFCFVFPLAGYIGLGFMIAFPVWLAVAACCLGIGFRLARDPSVPGSQAARYALLAFFPIVVGLAVYYLSTIDVLPSTWLTVNAVQFGSTAEVLLLALGLADRMNLLKAQKLAAERSARESQQALAARLEQQVRERTSALERANLQLAARAITDELTGAYNRRHFNEIFAAEIRRQRGQQRLAFCILDIDYFKSYNDRYGHQQGDEVLHRVAAALGNRLQRTGDKLFRLGGEEFGLVIGVNDLDKALGFVEALRAEVEALKIAHEGAPLGIVTASFGLLVVTAANPGLQPKDVYAGADALLYQAKSEGRNRVRCGVA